MSDHSNNCVEVELRPFKHQVGGHTCVLELTRSTICKPYVEREAWFYENEPEELKDFTPKYLGETYVTCDIQNDRKFLVARVTSEIASRDGPARAENHHEPVQHSAYNPCVKKRRKRPHSDSISGLEAWSSTCIDRQINQYGFWANNQPQKFIILENLVCDYERPCLMDLKMGVRKYGPDDETEEKRKLLEDRYALSTSATLGFRLCGSQVYKPKINVYTFHDKYFGRALDPEGAIKELMQFFHNGVELRVDVIRQVVSKLESLQSALMSQKRIFFNSASLLIIYDGKTNRCSTCKSCSKDLSLDTKNENSSTKLSDEIVHDLSNLDTSSAIATCSDTSQVKSDNNDKPFCEKCFDKETKTTKVDVRVIDFANVTENMVSKDGVENIADDTIVYGLMKLKEILAQILKDNESV
ncbi:inositol hexakisphosphate kinase 2-like isoform X2 [Ruditapes philippinarum]|nr:inositol hexakisphosphate kinase 2-like isoform X2 [Ruditapes philippinarum]XP_060557892.1 inositol hexakisphosphate kinase 2-like isoform X2 [Ruditapes philippinarum]XP_060557893.1 inositol hexakisphosphate kinase 2-like isoform X2 [Ruditapes philippinarum]XP_060557894.1 inositol hexakisphosphate kinase 2-like isoform X2 [Ruditapes philippinarum]